MIIFGSTLSPYVRKAVAFAREKGLDFELRSPRPGAPDPEFMAASPFHKMPALADGDYRLADSSAIIHYMEALKPDPVLIPSNPKERGQVIWFDEFADTIMSGCGAKMFYNRVVGPKIFGRPGDLESADTAEREELPPILDYLEGIIPDSGFLVGDRLTLADLAVASPLANLEHLSIDLDSVRRPKLMKFAETMLGRPSFAGAVAEERLFMAKIMAT